MPGHSLPVTDQPNIRRIRSHCSITYDRVINTTCFCPKVVPLKNAPCRTRNRINSGNELLQRTANHPELHNLMHTVYSRQNTASVCRPGVKSEYQIFRQLLFNPYDLKVPICWPLTACFAKDYCERSSSNECCLLPPANKLVIIYLHPRISACFINVRQRSPHLQQKLGCSNMCILSWARCGKTAQ